MEMPVVSIITPVFNAERFLHCAINSVARQAGEITVEHILVNDCSTDSSAKIIEEMALQFPHIIQITLDKNSGPVVARNAAITIARGRYICFLDADDTWLPEKISSQVQFMEATGAALSYTDYRCISEDGLLIGPRLRCPKKIDWAMHHMTRYIGCLTVMVDRHKVPEFTFPNINPAVRAEDFLAWSAVIAKYGPALCLPQDLARYSVVAKSRSSNYLRASRSVWRLYRNIENIPIYMALLYFSMYASFAALKRLYCVPRWDRAKFEEIPDYPRPAQL